MSNIQTRADSIAHTARLTKGRYTAQVRLHIHADDELYARALKAVQDDDEFLDKLQSAEGVHAYYLHKVHAQHLEVVTDANYAPTLLKLMRV